MKFIIVLSFAAIAMASMGSPVNGNVMSWDWERYDQDDHNLGESLDW